MTPGQLRGQPEQVIGDLRVMLARTEDERSSRFDGVVGKMVQRQAGQKRTEQVRAAVARPAPHASHLLAEGSQACMCMVRRLSASPPVRTETGSQPGDARASVRSSWRRISAGWRSGGGAWRLWRVIFSASALRPSSNAASVGTSAVVGSSPGTSTSPFAHRTCATRPRAIDHSWQTGGLALFTPETAPPPRL